MPKIKKDTNPNTKSVNDNIKSNNSVIDETQLPKKRGRKPKTVIIEIHHIGNDSVKSEDSNKGKESIKGDTSVIEEEKPLKKKKEKKGKPTLESVMKEIEEMETLINQEIDKRRQTLDKNKGLSTFRNIGKKISHLKKVIPKVAKKTRVSKPGKNNFNSLVSISKELATFLKVDPKDKIARDDIICALFTYVNIKPNETREKILRWKHLNSENRDLRVNLNLKES